MQTNSHIWKIHTCMPDIASSLYCHEVLACRRVCKQWADLRAAWKRVYMDILDRSRMPAFCIPSPFHSNS